MSQHIFIVLISVAYSFCSMAANSATEHWAIGDKAVYAISGYAGEGTKTLELTEFNNNKYTIVQTVKLNGQEEVCKIVTDQSGWELGTRECNGAVPKYKSSDFYGRYSHDYRGGRYYVVETPTEIIPSVCSVYGIDGAFRSPVSVTCTALHPNLPFWGEVITGFTKSAEEPFIIYTELISYTKM